MTNQGNITEELDILAAEYALGLADEADRARASALAATDEEFALRVEQWRAQGTGWLDDVEAQPVGAHVWDKMAPFFEDERAAANDVSGSDIARSEVASTVISGTTDWAARVRVWRNRSYLAAAASVLLAVALGTLVALGGLNRSGADPSPRVASADPSAAQQVDNLAVAQIADSEGLPLISAAYDSDQGSLQLRVADFGVPDKAPELWVLDSEGKPYSLGLVEGDDLKVRISDELRDLLVTGAIIAVTLEDRETAPHDAPTGTILGTGQLVTL